MIDIKDLIGKSFKLGACGPKEWDCYSLTKEIARRRGFLLPDVNTIENIDFRIKLLEKISSEYAEVISKPESFCVVVFNMGVFGGIHCGTVLEGCRQFIHGTSYIHRIRIDRLSSYPFRGRVIGFYRLCKKIY